MPAMAYDFSTPADETNTMPLYYEINADNATVTLTYGDNTYKGASIIIPETVTHDGKTYTVTCIGIDAFKNAQVDTLAMANTITEVQQSAFADSNIPQIGFSKNLKYIGNNAFYESHIVKVYLPEGLISIGENAFIPDPYSSVRITELRLPAGLQEIGEGAFEGQRSLHEVALPASLKHLKKDVFGNCANLVRVVLPEGLESIGDGAFAQCPIAEMTFPSTLTSIGSGAFTHLALKEVVLPDNIKQLGRQCFAYSEMKSIRFSAGLTELPQDVVSGCDSLIKVSIPEGITRIGHSAFSGCKRLSSVTFPESVTEVGNNPFYGSGLSSFTFPSKLAALGLGFFNNCTHLQAMVIPETVKDLGERTFESCRNLRKVVLHAGITEIPDDCFRYCESLNDFVLPENVKVLGDDSFDECTSLTELKLPAGLRKVGFSAFSGCEKLSEMTFPNSVDTLGYRAFDCYEHRMDVHINRAVPPIGWAQGLGNPKLFSNDNNECTLYVPRGSKATYEADGFWNAKEIVEEDVDGTVIYQITAAGSSYGSLTVDETELQWNNKVEKPMGSTVTLVITPDEGYHLEQLLCNGNDVTDRVEAGRYTVESLDKNLAFEATFARNPYMLYLRSSDAGEIGMPVVRNTLVTYTVKPAEGWKVNSIYLNNRDVTGELTAESTITVKAETDNMVLRVAFDNVSGIARNEAQAFKAHVSTDGMLRVEGLSEGRKLTVYDAEGKTVHTLEAQGATLQARLPAAGVYLVVSGGVTVKVIY